MNKKFTLYALHCLLFLFILGAHAQDIAPGYYRVTNIGLSSYGGTAKGKTVKEDCYAYVANGSYHMATGSGATQNIESMQMRAELDSAIVSPQTVIYIEKSGSSYNLEAQGKNLREMIGGYTIIVNIVSGTTDTYTLSTTVSGIAASLWVDRTKTGKYTLNGIAKYPSHYKATTSNNDNNPDAFRQWKLVPISTSSDNYVAVNASLAAGGKYYAPYYASYPFKLVSPGMKAYYVSGITNRRYALKEITSEVIPGATPVIIECSSNNPADCKIEPLHGNYGSVSGNKLKGVYFCNLDMSPKDYSDCRTEFNPANMRVWAVKDGQLILTNSLDRAINEPNYNKYGFSGYWLRANESYLANVPSTAAAELVSAGEATTIFFDSDGGTDVESISGGEGDPVEAPENPTKTGYTFKGWNPALPDVFPAEDMTVKAVWEINKYTISFDTDGGTTVDPITQDYQTAITKPADPTKTGYTFAGWDKTIPDLMPAEDMTIKALWTVGKYTITFDTDGGTAVSPITQDYNTPVTAPENPTKTGYTFMGWDKEIPTSMPGGNVTIKAQWKINQYTITFDTNGGTAVDPITQDYQSEITAPANPTKTGYSFAGWDKEIPDIMPAEDMTIKALWTVGKFTITFDTDGGTTVPPVTQDYNTSITKPSDPTKTGYTFIGWDKEIPSSMPGENMTIKALWQINEYTLTYYVDGEVYKSEKKEYNSTITPEVDPSKTGYTFSGWSTVPEKMPANDVNITGTFSINRYTITFDTDGGTDIPSITQDYDTQITAPTAPTRSGYVFAGWDKEIPSKMPAVDVTIKALWNKLYTLSFDTDGGTEINPITAISGTSITAPVDPTRTGHTFNGWNPSVPSSMPEGDMVCKAIWSVNKYKVTFKQQDGTIISEKELDYGSTIEVPTITESSFKGWSPTPDVTVPDHDVVYVAMFDKYTITFDTDGGEPVPESIYEVYDTDITDRTKDIQNPMKEGYTFVGWDKEIPSIMPAENVTIKAQWQINQYTITFDSDGGTAVSPITQDYHSTVTAPEAPTKTGYSFVGWDKDIPSLMPAEDMAVKAMWRINQYTITFDTDGGTAINPITQDYQSSITKPSDPTKTGYTFAGWDKDIPTSMPGENVTIKALWRINQYTITFDSNGGTDVAPITQDYQSAITAPDAPTKTGYSFIGWENLPSLMPAENMTVKAQWQINQYTITFDTDGGIAVNPITQDYQSSITKPADPTRTGYTFVSWDKDIPTSMPAEDMTIKAQWQINQYTITFDTDGGTEVAPITQDYNSAVTVPDAPTKTGYTFNGWNKDIPSSMPAENMTIRALWQINQYTITFDTDGGTDVASITQNYQSTITPPDAPTKTGYTFVGWDKEIPSSMPAENITIKAQWKINEYTLSYYTYTDDVPTLYKSEKVTYNSKVTVESPAEKVGYTFLGWKYIVNETEKEIPSVMPAYDVTITGTFTINKYTITFDADGGTEVDPITQDYDTQITAPANPTKEGFDFAGWSPALPEIMPAKDMDLKAIWGPKVVPETTYELNTGWTWASFYMINEEMSDFATVLANCKWTSVDEIKGEGEWAIYSEKKKKWVGSLTGFNDLTMYKIHSSDPDNILKLAGSYLNSKGDKMLKMVKGWNYLAYLSLDAMSVDEALQNYAATEGDMVKSQTASATYTYADGEWKWKGDLTLMEPCKGYMLYHSADDAVEFCYPIAAESNSNSARAIRLESNAQPFSSNMTVFATVEGVMAVPGDSIVAFAIDGVRGATSLDNEGKACLTIQGDNNADVYLALMHNNEVVASAMAPLSYVSDDIIGTYANPTSILFAEGNEAWNGDFDVTAIYTMDGKKLPATDVKTLSTGLYIVKYETLSDNNSNTGGCRVIRVVQ